MNTSTKLINKIFKQAEKGKIEIKNQDASSWKFFVGFKTSNSKELNHGELSVVVRDMKTLAKNIEKYLKVAREFYQQDISYFDLTPTSFDEKLVMDLFVNASNYNINNIEQYVAEKTSMIKESEIEYGSIELGQYLDCDIIASITKNHSNIEGPLKFTVTLKKDGDTFILPSITFGKMGNKVVLYAIQGLKGKQDNKLAKFLDRYFRKINKGVDMHDEILTQVSPNALVSLTVFLAYQKSMGINMVEAISFLPVRYFAQLNRGEAKAGNMDSLPFLEAHDRNQYNATNRFLNTIIRYAYHFNLNADFDDIKEVLSLNLDTNSSFQDQNIIHIIDDKIFMNVNKNEATI